MKPTDRQGSPWRILISVLAALAVLATACGSDGGAVVDTAAVDQANAAAEAAAERAEAAESALADAQAAAEAAGGDSDALAAAESALADA